LKLLNKWFLKNKIMKIQHIRRNKKIIGTIVAVKDESKGIANDKMPEALPEFIEAPDFGPGSYIGFRSANNHYGYLEVTWTSATNTFEVLSGAYESQPGVGIRAGAAAIPEPSSAALSLGALAAGVFVRRRKQAANI
jgi:hypothetical protein